MALLHFMRWFQQTVGWPFSCLLRRGGELTSEFAALCPTDVVDENIWRPGALRDRLLSKLQLQKLSRSLHESSLMRRQKARPDLIYCNTIAALPALEIAAQNGARVVCHVHELQISFRSGVGPVASKRVLDLTTRFIACSHAVAQNLIERHGVAPERIDVVHEYIPTAEATGMNRSENRRLLREKLGLSEDTLIVGGSGMYGWRKGTDLFVQVAKRVRRLRPDLKVHFLWLGGSLNSPSGHEFLQDIENTDQTAQITVIGSQPDPIRYFSGLDLFLLPSREDPYPLVCLEAAACGVPMVCFERAGGMPEFVESDAGEVVPYLDIDAMASSVIGLLEDQKRRQRFGIAAREKVISRHDIAVSAPKLLQAMERTLAK